MYFTRKSVKHVGHVLPVTKHIAKPVTMEILPECLKLIPGI